MAPIPARVRGLGRGAKSEMLRLDPQPSPHRARDTERACRSGHTGQEGNGGPGVEFGTYGIHEVTERYIGEVPDCAPVIFRTAAEASPSMMLGEAVDPPHAPEDSPRLARRSLTMALKLGWVLNRRRSLLTTFKTRICGLSSMCCRRGQNAHQRRGQLLAPVRLA